MNPNDSDSPPTAEDGVVNAVAAACGLTIDSAPPLRLGGAINHVLRVATRRGDIVIRIHRPETTPDRLWAVHRIQDHLRAAGLPVPAIVRTRNGASWLAVEGRLVEVLEYVPGGHEVASWQDAAVVCSALGRLHAGVRTLDARDLPPSVYECYATPEMALRLLKSTDAAFQAQWNHAAYPAAAATRASTGALVRQLVAARREYDAALPRLLVHGDFVGNNVLVEGDRVVAILDFDRLGVRHRIDDVARTLMYVLSRLVYPRFKDATADKSLVDDDLAAVAWLIDRYTAASGWPLTPTELRALPYEMARAPLYAIVTAGSEPERAVEETLIFAPHVSMAQWLADHASHVSEALQDRLES